MPIVNLSVAILCEYIVLLHIYIYMYMYMGMNPNEFHPCTYSLKDKANLLNKLILFRYL